MFKEIKMLADRLDEAAAGSTRQVVVVSTKGMDPLLAQQAVDALMGRRRIWGPWFRGRWRPRTARRIWRRSRRHATRTSGWDWTSRRRTRRRHRRAARFPAKPGR